VTPEIARAMSLPSDVQGVLVQQVITDSPADQAGLQAGAESMTINGTTLMIGGDIIIGFGNQSVTSVDDLNSLLQQSQPGQRVTLTIVRDGREGRVRVILDQPPTSELQPSRFAR
jgi:serine protease Do